MSKLILTRYLYIYDEVIISLITELLTKSDINACYFWLSEIYYSGFVNQAFELIWFIYYDFYYIHNPDFESFIHKKNNIHNFKNLVTIIKNLFKMKSSSHVYLTRLYNSAFKNDKIKDTFRGRKPQWLSKIPLKYHKLFRFIHSNKLHLASISVPETIDCELFESIQIYFNLSKDTIEQYKTNIFDTHYDNINHKLWAFICILLFNFQHFDSNIHFKKKIYMALGKEEYENILNYNYDHNNQYTNNILPYKILESFRKYTINPLCKSFQLTRYLYDNIDLHINFNWQFYAYKCPLWRERFDKFKAICDNDNEIITFENDDLLEEFYSYYGYNPDEQIIETQLKSYVNSSDNWTCWYVNIFKEKSIYEFSNDFKLIY